MRRTTLAIALASGALAIPAVSLASGGGNDPAPSTTTTPVQQQDRGHDCPEEQRGGHGQTQL
jgi:hypothetical protein